MWLAPAITPATMELTQAYLKECFTYNEETGDLIWKVRPRQHFSTQRGWRTFNSQKALKIAGCKNYHNGQAVNVTLRMNGKHYPAQCLIWVILYGDQNVMPLIDHKDRDPFNNRKNNLRSATLNENQWNRSKTKANTSGFKGVYFDKSAGRYHAQITKNWKVYNLGRYDTPEEASAAYNEAAKRLHGTFARTT